jgi:hypothetical protein
LIEYADKSMLLPKALYAKSLALDAQGDSVNAKSLKQRIMAEFPKTDYALAIVNADNSYTPVTTTSDQQLVNAEASWASDSIFALDKYREIIIGDTVSASSVKAALLFSLSI